MDQDEMVARQVLKLARKVKHRRNLHIKDLDMTTEQADALKYFADYPNSTIAMFKDYQEITHQTARLIVQHLVKKGLVILQPNPADGRAKLVAVTAAGIAKRTRLKQHGWKTSAELFKGFTAAEQQQFLALLGRANANLERGNE